MAVVQELMQAFVVDVDLLTKQMRFVCSPHPCSAFILAKADTVTFRESVSQGVL